MKHYRTCTDKELVNAFCQLRDKKAFDEIYLRYVEDVYRFVYSRIMHTQTSEDVVSETFITLLSCLSSYDGSAKLKTYIIGIAINKIWHAYRDKQRKKEVYLNELLWKDEEIDEIDEYDEEKEDLYDKKLDEVLSLLPDKYRYILEHIYIYQESMEQIARQLNVTQNNARVLHHRALKKAISLTYEKKQ